MIDHSSTATSDAISPGSRDRCEIHNRAIRSEEGITERAKINTVAEPAEINAVGPRTGAAIRESTEFTELAELTQIEAALCPPVLLGLVGLGAGASVRTRCVYV